MKVELLASSWGGHPIEFVVVRNIGACWIHIRNRVGQLSTVDEEIRHLIGVPDNFSIYHGEPLFVDSDIATALSYQTKELIMLSTATTPVYIQKTPLLATFLKEIRQFENFGRKSVWSFVIVKITDEGNFFDDGKFILADS